MDDHPDPAPQKPNLTMKPFQEGEEEVYVPPEVDEYDNRFHISDILSVTTGRIVSQNYVDGLYRVVNYMTESRVSARQLDIARQVCAKYLLQAMPELKDVNPNEVTEDNYTDWIQLQEQRFGDHVFVKPLPEGVYGAYVAAAEDRASAEDGSPASGPAEKVVDPVVSGEAAAGESSGESLDESYDVDDPIESALNQDLS